MSVSTLDTTIYDVVGVGFGPSNVAIAIAIDERNAASSGPPLSSCFLEQQRAFGWHRGMLFGDATMQVSFLKDLVTQRNPSSDFTFVSYLYERGRLVDFINHKTLFPLRIEFHDYLEWAAARLVEHVTYDQRVTDVHPVYEGATVVAFDVVSVDSSGVASVRRARNVVVAAGLRPRLPEGITPGERVWHNSTILHRVETLPDHPEPQRFVVVGSGQSAAEVVDFLHRRFDTAEVCSVFTRYGYAPSDDSPFANRIFDPEAVDVYFDAADDVKRMLIEYHRNTNYSVVDQDLIADLYRRAYQEKVEGCQRLRVLNVSRVVDAVPSVDGVEVDVEHLPSGEVQRLAADALVYATGYRPTDVVDLLGSAGKLVARRTDGTADVQRDYRVVLESTSDAAVYVQGSTEPTHGITSTLLSNIAVRSGEIVESIVDRRDAVHLTAERVAMAR